MILTKNQQRIVNEADDWYFNQSSQVFQFAGIAGAGKSVVLNAIIDRLKLDRTRIAPMAYIGQAAIVMRLKGLLNARTIHSWIYEPIEVYKRDKNNNVIFNEYLNKPISILSFAPKKITDIDLIIIDEGSTVPLAMKKDIEAQGIRIIVTGDLCQLPPVIGESAYLTSGKVHYLMDPMRQALNSGLYYIATRSRKGLPIHEGFYGDCLVINEDDVTDEMILRSDVILCGKNKTRDRLNNYIRHNLLKIDYDIPLNGEKLICRKNNWHILMDGINLTNGLMGTVINTPGIESFDGETFGIDFLPNISNSPFRDIRCDYKYLKAPHEQKKFLKNTKYYTGEKFEYAYAITTHLSQGATFNNGMYFEEFLNKDIQDNLNYTGVTRFSDHMIYVKRKPKYFSFYN